MSDAAATTEGATTEGATTESTAPVDAAVRRNLIGLTREQLAAELAPHGIDGFRLRQVWHWLYHRGGRSFPDMTTLSKPVRAARGALHRRPARGGDGAALQ